MLYLDVDDKRLHIAHIAKLTEHDESLIEFWRAKLGDSEYFDCELSWVILNLSIA